MHNCNSIHPAESTSTNKIAIHIVSSIYSVLCSVHTVSIPFFLLFLPCRQTNSSSGESGCVARASTSAGVEIFSLCFLLALNRVGTSVAPLASCRLQEHLHSLFFSSPSRSFLFSLSLHPSPFEVFGPRLDLHLLSPLSSLFCVLFSFSYL